MRKIMALIASALVFLVQGLLWTFPVRITTFDLLRFTIFAVYTNLATFALLWMVWKWANVESSDG